MKSLNPKFLNIASKVIQNRWRLARLVTVLLLIFVFAFSGFTFFKYVWKVEIKENVFGIKNTEVQTEKLNEITQILKNKEEKLNSQSLPIFPNPFESRI